MEKLKNRLLNYKTHRLFLPLKNAASQLIVMLISFLMSSVSFAGGLSPFATGFTAGIKSSFVLMGAIGSALGYLTFLGFFDSLRFVSAVCLICLLSVGIKDRAGKKYALPFVCISSFLSCFISSLAVFIAVGGESSYLILCFCEALISSAFAAFTLKFSEMADEKRSGAFFAVGDTITVIFFGCVLLLSLDSFRILGFSPARCAACFAVMLFALCGKEAASSVTGISCALTLGFSDNTPHLMPFFILSGLFSGICSPYGKFPVAISLVLSCVLALVLRGEASSAMTAITEAAAAGIIFVFIPERLLFSVAQKVAPLSRDAFDREKSRALHFSLRRSAKAVRDISDSVCAVSELLKKTRKPPSADFCEYVKEDVCQGCTKYDFCWDKCKSISHTAFESTNSALIKNGRLPLNALPERLTLICRMPEKICDSFNRAFSEHNARLVAKSETDEAKKAAARQFYAIGSILDDAAENLCNIPEADPVLANTAGNIFREMGFTLKGISAFYSPDKKSTIQVFCSHVPVIPEMNVLLERLFEATGRIYLEPVADEYSDEGTVLSFTEEGKFTVEYSTSSHTGAGEDFSGDTCECFFDGNGSFYAVLSDGMGSGARAAVDSVMTSSLMSRLMRAGFSPECALEAVNCALLIKSSDETLSTLDIVKIDLETGLCKFLKAGAAASVIKKGEKTLAVEKSSLPLGILRETGFEKSEITLSHGDMIFIMSDGASIVPLPYFKELIRDKTKNGTKYLAAAAVSKALELSPTGKHDDITVTCIRLKENR